MSESHHRYALKNGYKLHWYQIQDMLGKGGFGITYLAQDLNLDKPVAIKEYLPSEFAVRDEDDSVAPLSSETQPQYEWGLDRFIKEARILSRFEHSNIVRVHAVFEENNTGYMVMAYEHGQSLKDILKERRTLEEKEILDLILPIIDGLEQVHAQGFIHRDIKPDNIYVRENGSAVLLDFGSARQSQGGSQTMTSLISPGYAPFEQYYAKGDDQGPWTDIYGLGATLYRAVTGKKPLDAMHRSRSFFEENKEGLESASAVAEQRYSPGFLAAIDHALQFKASDRPQTLSTWRDELTQKIAAPRFPVVKANDSETLVVGESSQHTQIQTNNQPNSSSRSKPIVLGVSALAFLGLTWAGLVMLDGDGSEDVKQPPAMVTDSVSKKPPSASEDDNPLNQENVDAVKAIASAEQQALADEEPSAKEEPSAAQREQELLVQREAEQARLEKERQEELARQAEIKRILQEKRLAEKRRVEEEQRLAREKQLAALEQKIADSKALLATRSASKLDVFGYQDYVQARPLEHDTKKVIDVSAASNQWVSSGVLLERGKTYRIQASGTWKMGSFCNPSDAEGQGIYTLACWDAGNQTVPGFSHGGLIAKVGKETLAFYVGKTFQFTAERSGTLYFLSNDAPAFIKDNSGDLSVAVQHISD